MIEEDGQERCPQCVDTRTASYKAERESAEAEYAASREPKPQISQAPLASTFPGTIARLTNASGARVYEGAPLALVRNVATTLLLVGRSFSAVDTITASTGITVDVSARTATLTTLSLTAAGSMTPGSYHLIFNNVYFHNVLSVR